MFRHRVSTTCFLFLFLLPVLSWAADPLVPDPEKTPGDVLTTSRQTVCVRGYAGRVRHVPASVKRQVYRRYGMPTHPPGAYEIDHLVSLQLGGANSVANLWPQSYTTTPNAHDKDKLEQRLHALVCKRKLLLEDAQGQIAADWIAAYRLYLGPLPE